MNPKIRFASPFDTEKIKDLYLELVSDSNIQILPKRIAEIQGDPNTALFVGELNGRICATALVSLCSDVMYGFQPFSVVENVVVDPAFRGKGIGRALFSQIEDFCREKDCSKIMLLSSSERLESHNFFEKLGFKGDAKRGFVKYRSSFGGHSAGV